jgi:hypothetical protein
MGALSFLRNQSQHRNRFRKITTTVFRQASEGQAAYSGEKRRCSGGKAEPGLREKGTALERATLAL